MRTAAKVAAALGAVALGVGAPVAFVVQGAGAPGRPDSAELWWERIRRLPQPVLAPPDRASSVRAGGEKVERVQVEARVLEERVVPAQGPVVAIAERDELVAVATFDDGAFAVERDGTAHRVEGVAAVNALAFDEVGNLCVASDDGAFVAAPGERARRVASGAFSAVARIDGAVWFAGRSGVVRMEGGKPTRWGADHGLLVEQPTSLASCASWLCLGGVDGLIKVRVDEGRVRLERLDGALPARFVTAVASTGEATWVGTFDGGLMQLGAAPLAPADGLPEGRINPRALAVAGDRAFAGTPAGLLVARGRSAALVPAGGAVSAVEVSGHGGVWLGLSGRVVRLDVEFPSEQSALAQAQSRIP